MVGSRRLENMNSGVRPTPQPQSQAAKSALALTHTLFRTFLLTVLGAIFVYILNVSYVWLSGILTAIAGVLGVVVLVRTIRFKQPRIILFGTISGLLVTAIMCLLVLTAVVFFQQITTLENCARGALTLHAQNSCQVDFQNSIPSGMR